MPLYRVNGGHDAYAVFSQIIEAKTASEARQLALVNETGWINIHDTAVFDDLIVFTEEGSVEEVTAEDAERLKQEWAAKPYLLSKREHATVLAALRHYQAHMNSVTQPITDIATNLGDIDPLNEEDIDGLCERINV